MSAAPAVPGHGHGLGLGLGNAALPPAYALPAPGRRISHSQLRAHNPAPALPASLPTTSAALTAVALAAAKTWVFHDEAASGGAGWLALCFWAGRAVDEVRDRWRGRKGKQREGDGVDKETELALTAGAAIRLAALLQAVKAVGPLRATIFLESSAILTSAIATRAYPSAALAGLCSLAVAIASPDAYLVLFCLLLSVVCRLEYIAALSPRAPARPRGNPVSLGLMAAAAVLSTLPPYLASAEPFLPSLTASPAQLATSLLAGALTARLPVPRIMPTGIVTAHLPAAARDRVALVVATVAIQAFALPPPPSGTDVLLALFFAVVAYAAPSRAVAATPWTFPATSTGAWTPMSVLPPAWRPHVQTILRTPASSRIFYFLMLNLAYFGVQMAYGIWTNSLGLISDAIHMLFDCLGLAVGLWASVAATWKPDSRYTFGYTRVETLSGFANGLFLILISIFIIFEGIQRIIDPPHMETQQLLLVSSIGLAINLFGMWATGGHHHHGHSHAHDHGHGHTHAHAHPHVAVHEKKVDHRHANGYGSETATFEPPRLTRERRRSSQVNLAQYGLASDEHHLASGGSVFEALLDSSKPHAHAHGHDHAHDHGPNGHAHTVDCDHGHAHGAHDHAHVDGAGHAHSHGLAHAHNHDHDHDDHDHDHDHGHDDGEHGHDHAHSHNMRGVFLHVLADTLGSVGVIVSTLLIRLTGLTVWDPIASLFIAALILASVLPLVLDAARVLALDAGAPAEPAIRAALAELAAVDGLASYAAPRFWPSCEGELVGSIHIQLAPAPANWDSANGSAPDAHAHGHGHGHGHAHAHAHAHGHGAGAGAAPGQTVYANADKVVARVERVLRRRIRGLTELVVQVEGADDRRFCGCMTGAGR